MAIEINKNDYPFHSEQVANASLSRNGSIVIADTTSHVGNWFALQVINDTILDIADDASICGFISGFANLEGITLPAGIVLYGNWTTVQLISGVVIMHNTIGDY